VVTIHSGSRGLGDQIGTDFLREMALAAPGLGIRLPDWKLACAPIRSDVEHRYLGAMCAAINCAREPPDHHLGACRRPKRGVALLLLRMPGAQSHEPTPGPQALDGAYSGGGLGSARDQFVARRCGGWRRSAGSLQGCSGCDRRHRASGFGAQGRPVSAEDCRQGLKDALRAHAHLHRHSKVESMSEREPWPATSRSPHPRARSRPL
jgi:tRNA-splicing ligase RtcB